MEEHNVEQSVTMSQDEKTAAHPSSFESPQSAVSNMITQYVFVRILVPALSRYTTAEYVPVVQYIHIPGTCPPQPGCPGPRLQQETVRVQTSDL